MIPGYRNFHLDIKQFCIWDTSYHKSEIWCIENIYSLNIYKIFIGHSDRISEVECYSFILFKIALAPF